jgi:hypothetical protein
MPPEAVVGWSTLTVPLGALISIGLVIGLVRAPARSYFSEA